MSGPTAGLSQKPQFPLGQYNKPNARTDPFGPLEGAKRTRFMFPTGSFNASGSSPYSTLDGSGRNNNKMSADINSHLIHTQNNYTQRMNITRIILPIKLLQPTNIHSAPFGLYKPFVSGDVMFSLRAHKHFLQTKQATPAASNLLPSYSIHVNLQTLNYIMINVQTSILLKLRFEMFQNEEMYDAANEMLQRNYVAHINELPWLKWLTQILLGVSTHRNVDEILNRILPEKATENNLTPEQLKQVINVLNKNMLYLMTTLFRISGIFIGSEYQGGQHQGDSNPCSHNPVDHSAAMQIAGKFEKIRNLWATCDRGVSSGDVLGFRLIPTQRQGMTFELSGNPQTSKVLSVEKTQLGDKLSKVPWFLLVPTIIGSELPGKDDHEIHTSMYGTATCYTVGLVNQMSKAVLSTEQLETVAVNAMSCTPHTNTEIMLQFSMPNTSMVNRMDKVPTRPYTPVVYIQPEPDGSPQNPTQLPPSPQQVLDGGGGSGAGGAAVGGGGAAVGGGGAFGGSGVGGASGASGNRNSRVGGNGGFGSGGSNSIGFGENRPSTDSNTKNGQSIKPGADKVTTQSQVPAPSDVNNSKDAVPGTSTTQNNAAPDNSVRGLRSGQARANRPQEKQIFFTEVTTLPDGVTATPFPTDKLLEDFANLTTLPQKKRIVEDNTSPLYVWAMLQGNGKYIETLEPNKKYYKITI